jgi:hypothetical protein
MRSEFSLLPGQKDLAIKQYVTHFAVEWLDVAVLSGTARLPGSMNRVSHPIR